MNYLPINIEHSYLLKENEHEYKTKYTHSVEDNVVAAERNVLPSVSGQTVKLYDLDTLLYYSSTILPAYILVDSEEIYYELEYRIFDPYIYNTVDDRITTYGGYATEKLSIEWVPYTSDPSYVFQCLVRRTYYDDGRFVYNQYRVDTNSDVGFRIFAERIISPYTRSNTVQFNIVPNDIPYTELLIYPVPMFRHSHFKYWVQTTYIDSRPPYIPILIENNPFGKPNNKKIVTQNLERSVIT